ncbi:hypothetical protein [Streptomyces sp. NBC_00986]|uniref:hypothetical protein n=1 Tax=Streptomyces sp. NBC_00986 TaxID=2903702 RepID=UPI0038683545|nr:hypothetical protein OG504_39425 [Streptomyces sp. NBC_00986]
MTTKTPKPSEPEQKAWLKKLDRATAAHEKTREALDGLVADARAAGVPLTAISEHTSYSREWVRKVAARIEAERSARRSEPLVESEDPADAEP